MAVRTFTPAELNAFREHLQAQPTLPYTKQKLASILHKKFPHYSIQQFRKSGFVADFLQELIQNPPEQPEVEIDSEESEPYQVINGQYEIKSSKGKLTFSVGLIDRLFFEFSEKGLNRTGAQIRLDHNLKPWEWGAIKNRLSLYKHSHIFSPYTWDNTPLELRQTMVAEKMEGLLQNTGQVVRQEYDKYIIKEYRKVVEKNRRHLLAEEEALSVLAEYFCQPRTITVPRAFNVKDAIEHLVVKYGDSHNGAEVDETNAIVLTLKYSPQVLRRYVDRMIQIINSYNAKKVTLIIVGDLIESSTGMNHKNSWQGMSRGYYGGKATISSFEMVEHMAKSIINLTDILGVSGNHDRGTSAKDEDTIGSVAVTVFWFLRKLLKGVINVEFHPMVLVKVIDNVCYIVAHGHLLMTKKASEIVKDYAVPGYYVVFVTAHKHTVDIPMDKLDYRHIQLGPLFTGNNYSEGLGFTSLPSFMVSYNLNNSGYAQTNIIPLLDREMKKDLTVNRDYLSTLAEV